MNPKDALTETMNTMNSHVSVRQYTSAPIPKQHLLEMIRAGQSASSSNFVQAYSIIRITDLEKREKIAKYSRNQHVKEASEFLLFCGDLKRLEHACMKHGVAMEHDNLENFLVTTIDTALMAQNIIVAAESLGYGGCYIGGVRNNPKQIGEIVGLPDKVFPLFGLCLGTPSIINDVKPRLPVDAILHENTYHEEKYEDILEEYDQTISDYYQSRASNNKNIGWTETMADFMRNKRRTHMREYMKSKGFNLP